MKLALAKQSWGTIDVAEGWSLAHLVNYRTTQIILSKNLERLRPSVTGESRGAGPPGSTCCAGGDHNKLPFSHHPPQPCTSSAWSDSVQFWLKVILVNRRNTKTPPGSVGTPSNGIFIREMTQRNFSLLVLCGRSSCPSLLFVKYLHSACTHKWIPLYWRNIFQMVSVGSYDENWSIVTTHKTNGTLVIRYLVDSHMNFIQTSCNLSIYFIHVCQKQGTRAGNTRS